MRSSVGKRQQEAEGRRIRVKAERKAARQMQRRGETDGPSLQIESKGIEKLDARQRTFETVRIPGDPFEELSQ